MAASDTVALLRCDSTTDVTTITISAVSADDGEDLGSLQTTVPGLDVADDLCEGSIPRERFNEDFSQLAMLLRGPNGEGSRAAAVEIASGEVLGPGPDPDEFASSPSHGSPTFDLRTGELWYIDGTAHRVVSRPVDAAASEAVDHGPTGSNSSLTVVDGTPWLYGELAGIATIHAWAVTINPSGTHAASVDDVTE